MSRPSLDDLRAHIRLWANRLPIGSEWRHYSGKVYEITGFGVNEKTEQIEVEYREASIGDKLELYALGSSLPVNLDITFHREAALWEDEVTLHRGELMPADQVASLPPEKRLELANEKVKMPRYRQVARVETFVELPRRA